MLQPIKETDFRWGLNWDDTVWYKSVKIVNHNNWDSAFKKVRGLIAEFKEGGVLC